MRVHCELSMLKAKLLHVLPDIRSGRDIRLMMVAEIKAKAGLGGESLFQLLEYFQCVHDRGILTMI